MLQARATGGGGGLDGLKNRAATTGRDERPRGRWIPSSAGAYPVQVSWPVRPPWPVDVFNPSILAAAGFIPSMAIPYFMGVLAATGRDGRIGRTKNRVSYS